MACGVKVAPARNLLSSLEHLPFVLLVLLRWALIVVVAQMRLVVVVMHLRHRVGRQRRRRIAQQALLLLRSDANLMVAQGGVAHLVLCGDHLLSDCLLVGAHLRLAGGPNWCGCHALLGVDLVLLIGLLGLRRAGLSPNLVLLLLLGPPVELLL